jgi:hypothetical protein
MRAKCPTHPPWLNHSSYTWPTVPVMKLLITRFSPSSCHFIPLRSKYSPQHPVLKHHRSMFLYVNAREQVSRPYKTKGKIIVLYVIILMFFDRKRENKTFWTEL